jgi:hypothetical protein
MRLPNFKSLHEFFAVNSDIVVDGEVHFLLAFGGYLVPPVHGVVGSSQKIDGSFPGLGALESADVCGGFGIVPYDVDFGESGAIHGSVSSQIALELAVIARPRMRNSHESEAEWLDRYVCGTGRARTNEMKNRRVSGGDSMGT